MLAGREARAVVNVTGMIPEVAGGAADFEWAEIARIARAPSSRGSRLAMSVQLWGGSVYFCELNTRRAVRFAEGGVFSNSFIRQQPDTTHDLALTWLGNAVAGARTSYEKPPPGGAAGGGRHGPSDPGTCQSSARRPARAGDRPQDALGAHPAVLITRHACGGPPPRAVPYADARAARGRPVPCSR
ncbi:hypothetical protein Scel_62940 [Streptomyces cellostaticus]|nr:hypothetical protein Scel_62940 [Streptomyces cellostaticus]